MRTTKGHRAPSPDDVPLATKLKPKTKPKAKSKREHVSDIEAEELSFGQPARQMKRARSSSGGGLALPSRSSSTVLPQGPALASTPQRNIENVPIDSEEEDWDEVAAAPPPSTVITFQPALANESDGSDEEEIDMNAFEAEMNEHLDPDKGSDEDFLAAAVMSEPEMPSGGGGRPISLNQFAGGTEASQDDDDYTSSEESDED
jgi:hypothetical protein